MSVPRIVPRIVACLLVLCGTVAIGGTASADESRCRESSYIPGIDTLTLTGERTGRTLTFQRDTDDNFPSVKVWVNGVYENEYRLPSTFAGGEIEARLDQRITNETWMGEVRQTIDQVPVLRVCGPWAGELP